MDMTMLTLVILLTVFGLVILLSASEYNGRVRFHDSAYYFKKQLFASALGLSAMYFVSSIDYHFFVRLAPAAYLLSMLLSTAVLLFGQEINGSRRWLNLGPLSFQPSEFAKVAVVLFLTWQIDRSRKKTDGFWFMCRTMFTLLPIVGLVGSNNLSTAIIILGIGVILIFASSPHYLQFIALGGAGIGFIAIFLLQKVIVWSALRSGGILKNMKKASRRSRDFTQSEAAGFLDGDWVTVYKNWASYPKPRMI